MENISTTKAILEPLCQDSNTGSIPRFNESYLPELYQYRSARFSSCQFQVTRLLNT